MIQPRFTFNDRSVLQAFRKGPARTLRATAQELNRQLRTSKGGTGRSIALPVVGMTRRIQRETGIKPQKRIARRIRFPRSGFAKATRLIANGLTLFALYPMRYFDKGIPSGAQRVVLERDGQGREFFGAPFPVKLKSGAQGTMRKLKVQTPRYGAHGGHLPINWSEAVDITPIAYRERLAVLRDLARAWPRQWANRMRKELKRVFGA